ncbi:hypothetical protein BDW75DRAFT_248106 [Aspergillus navahoensis]
MPLSTPFSTNILDFAGASSKGDGLPACYQGSDGLDIPGKNVEQFLVKELSLGKLEVLKHLWYAGAVRSAKPLHEQIRIGQEIVIAERMDLHLLWTNDRKLFIKPLPCFLLKPGFWRTYFCCQPGCQCGSPARKAQDKNNNNDSNSGRGRVIRQWKVIKSNGHSSKNEKLALEECSKRKLWKSAMGFLYTYGLLPRQLSESSFGWQGWKRLVSEVLSHDDSRVVHPRFLRAELRLSRLDTIHRLTQLPPFEPYLRHHRNYGSLFYDNITLLATATVFIALVLTAMQVGLATEQLGRSKSFMAASYGFTVFAILGPLCAFGLMILEALWHFLKDLPKLLQLSGKRRMGIASGTGELWV